MWTSARLAIWRGNFFYRTTLKLKSFDIVIALFLILSKRLLRECVFLSLTWTTLVKPDKRITCVKKVSRSITEVSRITFMDMIWIKSIMDGEGSIHAQKGNENFFRKPIGDRFHAIYLYRASCRKSCLCTLIFAL